MTKLWIATAVIALSGCSLLFVEGPGNWTPDSRRAPVCDDEAKLPILGDVALGVWGALALGVGVDGRDPTDGDARVGTGERVAAIAAGAALLGTATVSIATGLRRARRCRAAEAEWLLQR